MSHREMEQHQVGRRNWLQVLLVWLGTIGCWIGAWTLVSTSMCAAP